MYSLQRTVDPATEPVTLDQVKAQCRLDPTDTSQDTLLTLYIRAAREYVEKQTGRALIAQTWVLTRDSFRATRPEDSAVGTLLGSTMWIGYLTGSNRILLPGGRVQSISSVQYFDATNTQQTLSTSIYVTDTASVPASVAPVPGCWWPATAYRPGAVSVTYVVGYGATATAVPASLCLAILLLVGHFYENREATQAALTGNGPLPLPLGVDSMLEGELDTCLTYES